MAGRSLGSRQPGPRGGAAPLDAKELHRGWGAAPVEAGRTGRQALPLSLPWAPHPRLTGGTQPHSDP